MILWEVVPLLKIPLRMLSPPQEGEHADFRTLDQYRRDPKRCEKRGKPMEKMRQVILLLLSGEPLPARYRDHTLSGDWIGHRECHVDPDWLLIYKVDTESLYLVRTGSHSDLFSK